MPVCEVGKRKKKEEKQEECTKQVFLIINEVCLSGTKRINRCAHLRQGRPRVFIIEPFE